jgi:hypothetical protein
VGLSASSLLGGVERQMVCLLNGVRWAVWESCGGAEAGHWGGMVGLVSVSAVLGGMECAAVKLVGGGAPSTREVAAVGLSMHGAG